MAIAPVSHRDDDKQGGQFELSLGDFSGPLDLLCHLIETRSLDASSVKLTDVLSQYVGFLASSGRATLMELADFFSLASRLLLGKVRALVPAAPNDDAPPDDADLMEPPADDIEPYSEEELRAMVERFRPYRAAASMLAARMTEMERYVARELPEGGTPWFDIGDLYGLASHWWALIADRERERSSRTESVFITEIPDAMPFEVAVDSRMDDVREVLSDREMHKFSSLVEHYGRQELIVTLLALLELSRLDQLDMLQPETWGDIEIMLK